MFNVSVLKRFSNCGQNVLSRVDGDDDDDGNWRFSLSQIFYKNIKKWKKLCQCNANEFQMNCQQKQQKCY